MPELNFQIDGAEAVPFAAAPLMAFKLRVTTADPDISIQTVALRCQIQIEAAHRHYNPDEQERLLDLFGEPQRWSQTLRSMLWTHTTSVVTPFVGTTVVDLQVPCTFDFNVASAKYFAGLEGGEVPLIFLFSGTIFYQDATGALQIEQIPWDREAKYRLPVRIWKEMIDVYYPNTAWMCLRRDVFDRLNQYKTKRGIPTWEQAIGSLLPAPAALPQAEPVLDEISIEGTVQ
jgi:hypothetical protein